MAGSRCHHDQLSPEEDGVRPPGRSEGCRWCGAVGKCSVLPVGRALSIVFSSALVFAWKEGPDCV